LSPSVIAVIRKGLGNELVVPVSAVLSTPMKTISEWIGDAETRTLSRSFFRLAMTPCTTGGIPEDEVGATPWADNRLKAGKYGYDLETDEWDGADWSRALDIAAIQHISGEEDAAATEQESLGDLRAHRADVLPADWDTESILRVLLLSRTVPGGWADPRSASVVALAAKCGRGPEEVLAFAQLLAKVDLGMAPAPAGIRHILREYPRSGDEDLKRRVTMLDADELEDLAAVEPPVELLDVADEPLLLDEWRAPTAADGGPDPLAIVRQLLPGGRGTRGIPPIVYTPTKLERELLDAILASPPTLVILSGNAGDGKTAFLETVLKRGGREATPGQNEYTVELGGANYIVVLDGSEDTFDRSNDELLHDALHAFSGDSPMPVERGTVIAINKGRLLKFLETRQAEYAFLWRLVSARYLGGEDPGGHPWILVDLNDRSGVAPDLDQSILGGIVRRLGTWPGWDEACAPCSAFEECPVRFNAKSLGQPPVASQVWRLLAAIDLDDRFHVTTRHIVTTLATAVVGDMRCSDIRQTINDGKSPSLKTYAYSALVAAAGPDRSESAMERVISSYDPAEQGSPRRDRQLAYVALRGSTGDLVGSAPGPDRAELEKEGKALASSSVDDEPAPGMPEYRLRALDLVRHASRRLHFLDATNPLAPRLPVASLDEFLSVGKDAANADSLVSRLVQALNGTLGLEVGTVEELVAPREYSRGLRGTGFAVLVPSARFRVQAGDSLGNSYSSQPFLESWPRSLRLEARDVDGGLVAALSMPLLMFEIVGRAARGFRPTSQTERNYMVRIDRFYRVLADYRWLQPPLYALYENGRVRARATLAGTQIAFAEAD
jgi:hypothetical protein